MYTNLFMIILCIWILLGFIAYGIGFANGFIRTTETKNEKITSVTKILFLIFCMFFGPFALWGTYEYSDSKDLRFW